MKVYIVGAGLAGSEISLQLAERNYEVVLFEQRKEKNTGVFKTPFFAELVCSNSLGSYSKFTGSGLLKRELLIWRSFLLRFAFRHRIPCGKALCVDPLKFAKDITKTIENHPRIKIFRERVKEIPGEPCIIATGPLTDGEWAQTISSLTGKEFLYFYDAVSPIVSADSIDYSRGFWGSRYEEKKDYFNCTMNKEEYSRFYEELVKGETVSLHEHEKAIFFEACLPIEEMARRGKQTPLFGPLKPIGFNKDGKSIEAIVQLRKYNKEGTLFQIVGFQTRLKWSEQKRIFRMIPCLRNAEFVRYGVVHRNTYIKSPEILDKYLRLKKNNNIYFAGQITGVEGYTESISTGLWVSIFLDAIIKGKEPPYPPEITMTGSLLNYITQYRGDDFVPMNANMGILPHVSGKRFERKKKKFIKALSAMIELRKNYERG